MRVLSTSASGGTDDLANLAWACHRCNAYKGPNIASIDPEDGAVVPLFQPRRDPWEHHFRTIDHEIIGLTPTGRVTAALLRFNDSYRVELREAWLRANPSRA